MRNNKELQKRRKDWQSERVDGREKRSWEGIGLDSIEIAVAVGSQRDGSTLADSSVISAKKDDFTNGNFVSFPGIVIDYYCCSWNRSCK